MLRIRAFNAPDDIETGERFVAGHKKVLEDLGVVVTSGKADWVNDPYVYVLAVEDTADNNKVVGGARVHVANSHSHLPMVEAIAKVDDNVYDIIGELIPGGTAEICGMWNNRDVMGYGLGARHVMRSSIALASQLNLTTMLSLASKATRQRGYDKGFEPLLSLGVEGEFNYPKLDLIATAVICYDPILLPKALPEERKLIHSLREKLVFEEVQSWPRGTYDLAYDLKL